VATAGSTTSTTRSVIAAPAQTSRPSGSGDVTALSTGNYVVGSPTWNNGAGAATWGSGAGGLTGLVSAANSLLGTTANANLQPVVVDDVNHTFFGRFIGEVGGRVRVGSQDNPPNVGGVAIPNDQGGLALEGVRPNPSIRNRLSVVFALPSGAHARLDLMDVSGRRVVSREVGSMGPGRHTVNLSEGCTVASGVYWVRLTQGANRRTTQVAVID
jgi:hypothetical protein